MAKKCKVEHTRFQPKVWACPVCGEVEGFNIEFEMSTADCPLLHVDDLVSCDNCGSGWTGEELVNDIQAMEEAKNSPVEFDDAGEPISFADDTKKMSSILGFGYEEDNGL